MEDLDLEELESRLYSQIYHGLPDETDQIEPTTLPETNAMSKPTNDVKKSVCRYFGPWSPTSKFQGKNLAQKQAAQSRVRQDVCEKQNDVFQKPSPVLSEVIVLSKKARYKAAWREKLKERRKRKRALKRILKETELARKIQAVALEMNKNVGVKGNEVITLSDSDDDEDDSCVLINNPVPLISVADSDDENTDGDVKPSLTAINQSPILLNESFNDEVIFIEPEKTVVEVINLDDDVQDKSSNSCKSSTTSSENINLNSPRKNVEQLHQERKELLNTPDSASNDFMSNSSVELGKQKFNFSLHGSDFHDCEGLKASTQNEQCETESSSSAVDGCSSVNLMKNIVFNEVDFPREEIFSDGNLESFGKFITPLRSTSDKVCSSPTKGIGTRNDDLSDSGSDNYVDEAQNTKSMNLPELSSVVPETTPNLTPIRKKSKRSSMCSKYDLLNSNLQSPQSDDNPPKSIKKKKKKKKRVSMNEAIDSDVVTPQQTDNHVNNAETPKISEKSSRHKKRRSAEMETPADNNLQHKRKSLKLDEPIAHENPVNDLIIKEVDVVVPQNDSNFNTTADKTKNTKIQRKLSISEDKENSGSLEMIGFTIQKIGEKATVSEISSDPESVLSELQGEQDIQLNFSGEPGPSETNRDYSNFSVTKLKLAMSDDPSLWEILDSDRYPIMRSRGRRCNKCKQFGHIALRCTNKVEVKCSLCGNLGHYEPRCPNKICTQCGQRSPYSTTYCNYCFKFRNIYCNICNMPGHPPDTCPDLWRRYYLTTTEGAPVPYTGPELKQRIDFWCSGCAQSGHLEHECRLYKPIYPPTDPFIKSFEDINDNRHKPNQNYQPYQNSPVNSTNFNFNNSTEAREGSTVYNYNQNNIYQQTNNQFISPVGDGIFINNQQNFFSPHVVQVPQQSFPNRNQMPFFEDTLPAYISFDDHQGSQNFQGPCAEPYAKSNQSKLREFRRKNEIFFSSSVRTIQHFISGELYRLSKISLMSDHLLKEMKKRPVPMFGSSGSFVVYETLNMLLFGVRHFEGGQKHLELLKNFKFMKCNLKANSGMRKRLYNSYRYIFGHQKHYRSDYGELLRNA